MWLLSSKQTVNIPNSLGKVSSKFFVDALHFSKDLPRQNDLSFFLRDLTMYGLGIKHKVGKDFLFYYY